MNIDRFKKQERKRIQKRERSTKPQPLEPLRSWIGKDGEVRYALHPLYCGIKTHYGAKTMADTQRLLVQIHSGDRRLPDGVAEAMLEMDAKQQASGCPDENISGLIELLRSRYGGGADDAR